MEHFPDTAWVDFVRRLSGSENQAQLNTHLATGCKDCRQALALWNQVHTIALRESLYHPPEEVVSKVKREFGLLSKTAEPTTASLIFDSFSQPLLAGVRSSAAAARQIVYEADGLTADLRFDGPPHSTKICLTGQVLDRRVPRAQLADAAIMLWTQNGLPIAETRTNNFGEFHLEFEAQDHLRLSIQTIGGKLIRIPLANLKLSQSGEEITDGTDAGYC